jgi:hypothetical protein
MVSCTMFLCKKPSKFDADLKSVDAITPPRHPVFPVGLLGPSDEPPRGSDVTEDECVGPLAMRPSLGAQSLCSSQSDGSCLRESYYEKPVFTSREKLHPGDAAEAPTLTDEVLKFMRDVPTMFRPERFRSFSGAFAAAAGGGGAMIYCTPLSQYLLARDAIFLPFARVRMHAPSCYPLRTHKTSLSTCLLLVLPPCCSPPFATCCPTCL